MTPTITAIETEYAGYRFRSRLEARWAVAFTELGITWEYEPQGYQLPGGTSYLPDFRLTDSGALVEVKGQLDEDGANKILQTAAAGRTVILLEDIPDPLCGGPDFHTFRSVNGSVHIERASFLPGHRYGWAWRCVPFGKPLVVNDVTDPGVAKTLPALVRDRNLAHTDGWVRRPVAVAGAYRTARQARFEHGETPQFKRASQVIA